MSLLQHARMMPSLLPHLPRHLLLPRLQPLLLLRQPAVAPVAPTALARFHRHGLQSLLLQWLLRSSRFRCLPQPLRYLLAYPKTLTVLSIFELVSRVVWTLASFLFLSIALACCVISFHTFFTVSVEEESCLGLNFGVKLFVCTSNTPAIAPRVGPMLPEWTSDTNVLRSGLIAGCYGKALHQCHGVDLFKKSIQH